MTCLADFPWRSAFLLLADLTLELEEAQQMQIALLPESAPNISSLEIAGRNIGAKEVGGDFFDYLTKGARY